MGKNTSVPAELCKALRTQSKRPWLRLSSSASWMFYRSNPPTGAFLREKCAFLFSPFLSDHSRYGLGAFLREVCEGCSFAPVGVFVFPCGLVGVQSKRPWPRLTSAVSGMLRRSDPGGLRERRERFCRREVAFVRPSAPRQTRMGMRARMDFAVGTISIASPFL